MSRAAPVRCWPSRTGTRASVFSMPTIISTPIMSRRAPREGGADLGVAKRPFVRPDGSDFRLAEAPGHVDTSCWWFQPGAYHLLSFWVTIPREMTPIGDRVFSGLIDASRLTRADAAKITVN